MKRREDRYTCIHSPQAILYNSLNRLNHLKFNKTHTKFRALNIIASNYGLWNSSKNSHYWFFPPRTTAWQSQSNYKSRKPSKNMAALKAVFFKVSSVRKALFGALEELFDLPLETKVKISSKKPFHGYVQKIPKMLPFESLGIDDANVLEKVKGFTDVLWPEGNPKFW